ncbi:MAG: UDP-N-acetyl glucosamine 2-epimerase [Nitrososphaeraceae archaeon]
MKIVSVVGARPNFVKLAPIHSELSKYCEHVIIHTGQHYDYEMSDVFFKELSIPQPDINLEVGSGPPGEQIGEMIRRLEAEFGNNYKKTTKKIGISSKPNLVLVYGDTNSTFAGALAASVNQIPVAHVEAGLRSFDRRMPEERNRILTDHLSSILFAPTKTGMRNLKREHAVGKVVNSGDISVEVMCQAWKFSKKSSILKELGLRSKSFILFTMHRAESTDAFANLKIITRVFQDLEKRKFDWLAPVASRSGSLEDDNVNDTGRMDSSNYDSMRVVFPLHPRTEKSFKSYGLYNDLIKTKNVIITKPLGYIDFLRLVKESYKVITDSGGVQKEAFLFSVPCITIRRSTEWIETLSGGWNVLTSFNRSKILNNILDERRLSDKSSKNNSKKRRSIFGTGNTSKIIRKYIVSRYGR